MLSCVMSFVQVIWSLRISSIFDLLLNMNAIWYLDNALQLVLFNQQQCHQHLQPSFPTSGLRKLGLVLEVPRLCVSLTPSFSNALLRSKAKKVKIISKRLIKMKCHVMGLCPIKPMLLFLWSPIQLEAADSYLV